MLVFQNDCGSSRLHTHPQPSGSQKGKRRALPLVLRMLRGSSAHIQLARTLSHDYIQLLRKLRNGLLFWAATCPQKNLRFFHRIKENRYCGTTLNLCRSLSIWKPVNAYTHLPKEDAQSSYCFQLKLHDLRIIFSLLIKSCNSSWSCDL